MDANDFICTLSEKGKSIIEEYLPNFKIKKIFTVEFSNESKVVHDDKNKYQIFINTKSKKNIEYIFFHEFFHCVQHEEGFPSLYSHDVKYYEITSNILSYVLDFNVRHRLQKYFYSDYILENNVNYNTLFENLTILNRKKQDFESIEYTNQLGYGMFAAMVVIENKNHRQNKKLLSLLKKVNIKIYDIYKIFIEIINKYNYNTKDGVYKILESIILALKLDAYIFIKT